MTGPRRAGTVFGLLVENAAATPGRTYLRGADGEETTWEEAEEQVRRIAAGLRERGIGPGDAVGLLLANVPELYLADLAVLALGAVPVSIYLSSSPEQIEHIVADAGIALLIDDPATVREIGSAAAAGLRDEQLPPPDPDALATIIYTSGTTGAPKGVELTQRAVLAAMRSMMSVVDPQVGDRVVSWLPSAHIAERGAHYYSALLFGFEVTACPDPRQVMAAVAAVRPHWFFAVPRIWEKVQAGIEAGLSAGGEEARSLAEAIERGRRRVELEAAGTAVAAGPAPGEDEPAPAALRARLGLDAARAVHVGSAPIARETLVFFHAIGLPLGQIWGLTESCACGTISRRGGPLGSVGAPVPGIELRLADDGEVLLRGPMLMRGYRGRAEATRTTLDAEGWLHTGDVGRLDDQGELWIVDRKKELIITAGGKNISPAQIEATLKAASPLIGQACAIGDRRPYLTALLVLDPEAAAAWGRVHGRPTDLVDLAFDPELLAEVATAVEAANARLAKVERIRAHAVLAVEWAPGGEELTPTSKLRRRPIESRWAAEIEALYTSKASPR